MKGNGAKAVVESLKVLRIESVFGIPGVQNIELFDALADAPFETVLVTNEGSAAFMADAHARVTGKLGVLVVIPGPGITNALTGLAEALVDSSPVLAIVSAVDSEQEKSFQVHEIDQSAAVRPLVKGIFKPLKLEDIPGQIMVAANLAKEGEPGPVVVEIPYNLLMKSGEFVVPQPLSHKNNPDLDDQLDKIADDLRRSPSVGIYAGFGAIDASDNLIRLAEILQAPVATTISGRGVIPEDSHLSVGFGFGPSGFPLAKKVFGRIHTLLAIGCKYGEVATGSYGLKLPAYHIHIDNNPAAMGANYPVSVSMVSDAGYVLEELVARLQDKPKARNEKLKSEIEEAKKRYKHRILRLKRGKKYVNPSRLLNTLRDILNRDAIIVTDSGNHQFWTLSDFPIYERRSYLTPADFQSMGFSIPAAIAAKLAYPKRQVVSLVGDGGFLMSGMELVTVRRLGIAPLVLVFRDGALGLIRDAQRRLYRRTPFTGLHNPDFGYMARALDMDYISIKSDLEIDVGLRRACSSDRPVLIDANVRYKTPTRYFKGTAVTTMQRLPRQTQKMIIARYAKRLFFSPPKEP
jgi:acetolactate synthase-1/2/3 large subunit